MMYKALSKSKQSSAAQLKSKVNKSKSGRYLIDNRPEAIVQRRVQQAANNHSNESGSGNTFSSVVSNNSHLPIQLVLRDNTPANRATERRLMDTYRREEAAGNRHYGAGRYDQARTAYTNARNARQRVRRMHTAATRDAGHDNAIQHLRNRIAACNREIRRRQQQRAGRAARDAARGGGAG